MRIIDWNQQPVQPTPHNVDIRLIYKKADFQIQHIVLEPGEALMPHYTPVDASIFILEGTPTIQIGPDMKEVEENKLIESPRYTENCIYNHSNSKTRILIVKPLRERPKNFSTLELEY